MQIIDNDIVISYLKKIVSNIGTLESYINIFRLVLHNIKLTEYYEDDTKVIIPLLIQEFYNRFVIADSYFRNPVLNYGEIISDISLAPQSNKGRIIRVINQNENSLYEFDGAQWNRIGDGYLIKGKGTPPHPKFAKFRFVDNHGNIITANEYNNLYINGMVVKPANQAIIEDITNSPFRAHINIQNPNVTKFNDPDLILEINNIKKHIIFNNAEHWRVTLNRYGVYVIDNTITTLNFGPQSKIKVIKGNSDLGIPDGAESQGLDFPDRLYVESGNITIHDGAIIPEYIVNSIYLFVSESGFVYFTNSPTFVNQRLNAELLAKILVQNNKIIQIKNTHRRDEFVSYVTGDDLRSITAFARDRINVSNNMEVDLPIAQSFYTPLGVKLHNGGGILGRIDIDLIPIIKNIPNIADLVKLVDVVRSYNVYLLNIIFNVPEFTSAFPQIRDIGFFQAGKIGYEPAIFESLESQIRFTDTFNADDNFSGDITNTLIDNIQAGGYSMDGYFDIPSDNNNVPNDFNIHVNTITDYDTIFVFDPGATTQGYKSLYGYTILYNNYTDMMNAIENDIINGVVIVI